MAFEDISSQMNDAATHNGVMIYESLKEIYPDNTLRDLDIMMNSMCVALACMAHKHVQPDDRRAYVQLIYQILTKNIN